MKISVITVTWNSAATIADTIRSVAAQTYPDIEYIVVDGASTDNTLEIVKSFGSRIDVLISEPDKGMYEALNKGIRRATGDIIGVLHADDFFNSDKVLDSVASQFNKHPLSEIVYADVLFVDRLNTNRNIRYYSSASFRPWLFRLGFQPAHPATYIRRECFEKYGYYREDFKIAGDFELLMRFIYINKAVCTYAKEVWVKMRIGGLSTGGFASTRKLNKEVLQACRLNKVSTNTLVIYLKYLVKWRSFVSPGE